MIEEKTNFKIKTLSEYEEALKAYQSKNPIQIIIDLDGAGFTYEEILYQFKKPMIFNPRNKAEKFFSYIKKYPLCFLYVLVSIAKEHYVEKRFWPYLFEAFHLKHINEGVVETRIRQFVTGILNNFDLLSLFPESVQVVDIFGIVAHAKVPNAYYDVYSNFIGNLFDLVEEEADAVRLLQLWRELYQQENVSKKYANYYQDKFQAKEELSAIVNALSSDRVFESVSKMLMLMKTQPLLVLNQKSVTLLKSLQRYSRQRSQLIAYGLSTLDILNECQNDYETYKEKINKYNLNIFNSLKKPMRYFLLYGTEYAERFLLESLNRMKQRNKGQKIQVSNDVHDYSKKQYAKVKKQNFNLASVGWMYSFDKGIHLEIGKIRIDADFFKQYQSQGHNHFCLILRNKGGGFKKEIPGGFNRQGVFDSNGSNRFSLDVKNPKDLCEIVIQDFSDKEFLLLESFTLSDDFCIFLKIHSKFKLLTDDAFPGHGHMYIWHKNTITIQGVKSTYDEISEITILENKFQDEVRIFDRFSPEIPIKILTRLESLNPKLDDRNRIKGLIVEGEENVFNDYPEVRFSEFDNLKNWKFQVDDSPFLELSSEVLVLKTFCPKKSSLYSFDHFRKYTITFLNCDSQENREITFYLFPQFKFETENKVFSVNTEKIRLIVTSEKMVNFNLRGQNIQLTPDQSPHEKIYEYTPKEDNKMPSKIIGVLSCRGDLQREVKFWIQVDIAFLNIFKKGEKIESTEEWVTFDKLTEWSVETNRNFNIMKIGFFKEKTDSKALCYQIIRINQQKRFDFKEIVSKKSLLPLDEPVYLHVKFSHQFKNETSYMPFCTVIKDTEDEEW